MSDDKKAENAPKPLPDIGTAEGRIEVMKRASKGDAAVQSLVGKLLDQDRQEGGRLLEVYGDSFRHASIELTKAAAGNDIMIRESLLTKIRAVRDELAGPNASPLERLLCERVALCWFDAYEMDRRYVDQSEMSFKNAEFRESRRDRAHKRLLSACKTLAVVRRHAGPAVQLTVAQQVNVGGSS